MPSTLLHDSIAYGLAHRDEALRYAMQFGRGLDRARTDRFVAMYVNNLTLDYGDRGRAAVKLLLEDASAAGAPSRWPCSRRYTPQWSGPP